MFLNISCCQQVRYRENKELTIEFNKTEDTGDEEKGGSIKERGQWLDYNELRSKEEIAGTKTFFKYIYFFL